ncbi:MAG: DUF3006 domain-containing protein [Anaerolineaceae bacterium]|nr:MAG: DUF3006 domain-containing protein [Anaerolineaceae bacterium]
MKKYIVDRFEGIYAVCEDEDKIFVNIERHLIPIDTKEGDCLLMNENGELTIDMETSDEIRQRIRSKLDSLFE